MCRIDDHEVPCHRDDLGWFNPSDRCYWKAFAPQPPASDPGWSIAIGGGAGASPDKGALYDVACLAKGAELQGGTYYRTTPPPGYGGMVDPAVIAQNMVSRMGLTGADIGTAPKQGGTSLVGLPVWLWNNTSATTWGPNSASASAGGVTVTATARVDRIIWSTGDGTSVTCKSPGKPYQPSYGTSAPDCGHTYTRPGHFQITATSKWVVDWTATTGQGGQILVDRTSNADVSIAEAQALNNR
ncbi:ATP/GTP-binding protein [Streptomyces sp. NRRL B-24484]|uniref:ATP/GTP-binding protein n=1 Tax=Streptomyces sp. NRRL B-24484 TaxID=1463833 RepID=UPI000B14C42B|nr:ATP/GTP-binding protein [Streptomyces sp. NRRL B-24484]